jgi:hypothetical protein
MLFTADHEEPRRALQKFIAVEINRFVMPGLVPGIQVLLVKLEERGWPGQARP